MNNVEAVFFSEELQEMSARLMSMVTHLDAKSPVLQPHGTNSTETLDKLLTAATKAEDAWKLIRGKIQALETASNPLHIQQLATHCIELSDDALGSAPMVKGLPWHIYATDPALPIRLSLIVMNSKIREVLREMEKSGPWSYDWFYGAVHSYIQAYERHRRHLQKHGA